MDLPDSVHSAKRGQLIRRQRIIDMRAAVFSGQSNIQYFANKSLYNQSDQIREVNTDISRYMNCHLIEYTHYLTNSPVTNASQSLHSHSNAAKMRGLGSNWLDLILANSTLRFITLLMCESKKYLPKKGLHIGQRHSKSHGTLVKRSVLMSTLKTSWATLSFYVLLLIVINSFWCIGISIMRLINTRTWILEEYFGSRIPKHYAILSHRWEEGEVTFQDWQDTQTASSKPGYQKI